MNVSLTNESKVKKLVDLRETLNIFELSLWFSFLVGGIVCACVCVALKIIS